jgi:hypothetical protein
VTPTSPPIDVILIILAVIMAASVMDAAGGIDFLVGIAEGIIRANPKYVTIVAPLTTRSFSFVAGTGHIVYPLLPVIYETAHQSGIRPERPLAVATIASQQAITASPVSAATAAMIGLFFEKGLGQWDLPEILMICVPATVIGVVVAAIISMFVGKDLKDDPEYQARLAAGAIPPPKAAADRPPLKPGATRSAILFLIAVALVVLFGFFPALRQLPGAKAPLAMPVVIEIVMLSETAMVAGWGAVALALAMMALGPSAAVAQTAAEATRGEQAPATGPGSPVWRGEGEFVRSPNDAPLPPLAPPQQGLLEANVPGLREALGKLPPFFRDMDVNARLRSFYFNRQNDNGTASEAWTLGGWVNVASGWLLDTFAVGATYYTSLPAYAPADRPGSLTLTPGQGEIGVFGEAWGALRYKDYALLRGYRLRIDEGYLNPQDNRMLPNTFEAVTVSGTVDWARYDVGYVTNIKPRDSNNFVSMSSQAGAPGSDKGLILTALSLAPSENLAIYAGNYYALDVFNTAFAKAEYTLPISGDLKLQFGLQYTDQRSVGGALVGDFATWNVGAGMRAVWRGLTLAGAAHFTGADASISSPWGTWPGYLSMLVTDFDRANEKAFGVGLRYDFGGSLLPFRIPGLTVYLAYVQGNDRIDPATGIAQPTTREGDLDIIYSVPGVKGLSLRFRNAYVSRGNSTLLKDFRIIVNYELDLL